MDLRPATVDDARLLWEWRNGPSIRAMSGNTDPIPWEEHQAWLVATLDAGLPAYVAEVEGLPIGTIRLNSRNEVSVTVAPDERGCGYGTEMIRLLGELHDGPLVALIKPENEVSRRAFIACGYTLVSTAGEFDAYRKR